MVGIPHHNPNTRKLNKIYEGVIVVKRNFDAVFGSNVC